MPVHTRRVRNRRPLRFHTTSDVLADARAIALAEERGSLTRLGNWTPGQAFGHIAAYVHFAYDGYPKVRGKSKAPWIIRFLTGFFKARFLQRGLPAGMSIPGIEGGTFAIDPMPTDVGLAKLEEALARLERETPTQENPVLGALTHEEWKLLQLRHAELHLSFQVPR